MFAIVTFIVWLSCGGKKGGKNTNKNRSVNYRSRSASIRRDGGRSAEAREGGTKRRESGRKDEERGEEERGSGGEEGSARGGGRVMRSSTPKKITKEQKAMGPYKYQKLRSEKIRKREEEDEEARLGIEEEKEVEDGISAEESE